MPRWMLLVLVAYLVLFIATGLLESGAIVPMLIFGAIILTAAGVVTALGRRGGEPPSARRRPGVR